MRSVYDAVSQITALFTGVGIQSLTGSTVVTSAAIDTKGFNSALIRVIAELTTSNPSVATVALTVTESATSGGSYAPANDNTGTAIGFTLDVHAARADNSCRLEGLNGENRKRFLKVVLTPAFTGGSSPAISCVAEVILAHAFNLPANTATSNT